MGLLKTQTVRNMTEAQLKTKIKQYGEKADEHRDSYSDPSGHLAYYNASNNLEIVAEELFIKRRKSAKRILKEIFKDDIPEELYYYLRK